MFTMHSLLLPIILALALLATAWPAIEKRDKTSVFNCPPSHDYDLCCKNDLGGGSTSRCVFGKL